MSRTRRPLTTRSIKAMLTRAGVDYSALIFEEAAGGTSVIIRGSRDDRLLAFHALLDCGLSVAPYPDEHRWSR